MSLAFLMRIQGYASKSRFNYKFGGTGFLEYIIGINMLKKTLKYLNSIPYLNFSIKHYYPIDKNKSTLKNGELQSAESWDELRKNDEHFSISENREEWLKAAEGLVRKDGQDGDFINRAREIVKIIDDKKIKTLLSVGVGGAGIEYQIKKMRPELRLVCSEYSGYSVEALKKVFVESDSVIQFDMVDDSWRAILGGLDYESTLVLMYRIDIDLNNDRLFKVFNNTYRDGVKNILIVICGELTIKSLFSVRLPNRIKWILKSIPYAFSGYLRPVPSFHVFWSKKYKEKSLRLAGLPSFLLERIDQ